MSKFFEGATKLVCKKLGKIATGQDGAFYGDYIFRIDAEGKCGICLKNTYEKIAEFDLDKKDVIVPHSNSICFGTEFYKEDDVFPLIYTNVYNNCRQDADRKEGVCCVYRVTKEGDVFSSQLVQIIRVGFVHDTLWRSENIEDIRPYGNFVIDTDTKTLYAFVMRDEEKSTRFFGFPLPEASDGILDEKTGVRTVILKKEDILSQFDSEYTNFMQGATCDGRFIYSVSGFGATSSAPPVLQIFDTQKGKCCFESKLEEFGLAEEPEMIDVYENNVYYSDCYGDIFMFIFE